MAVTLSEMRFWARTLGLFTAREIADVMGCSIEVGEKAIIALMVNEIIEQVDYYNERGELVPIYEVIPLPGGPKEHHTHTPPEVVVANPLLLYNRRGLPVRLVDEGKKGTIMQSPGGRRRLKERDRNYERMETARRERAEKDREKSKRQKEKIGGKRGRK